MVLPNNYTALEIKLKNIWKDSIMFLKSMQDTLLSTCYVSGTVLGSEKPKINKNGWKWCLSKAL